MLIYYELNKASLWVCVLGLNVSYFINLNLLLKKLFCKRKREKRKPSPLRLCGKQKGNGINKIWRDKDDDCLCRSLFVLYKIIDHSRKLCFRI